jgi:hypothetical protein
MSVNSACLRGLGQNSSSKGFALVVGCVDRPVTSRRLITLQTTRRRPTASFNLRISAVAAVESPPVAVPAPKTSTKALSVDETILLQGQFLFF